MNSEAEPDRPSDAESIVRLRGEGPRVVRLSRKAIGIASAAALTLVGGALIYALQPVSEAGPDELFGTETVAVADGLASGEPILNAQDRGAVAALPPVGSQPAVPQTQGISPAEAARQRIEQEREVARASGLFFAGATAVSSTDASPTANSNAGQLVSRADAVGSAPAFLERPADRRTSALQQVAAAPTDAVLQAGSVIPAALITGVRSDQPGLVTAQVTQNVYDSLTERILLIPQGARLIGDYASDVGFGQRRVLLAWNRLILPDGRSLVLERQPATDPSGYAGLEDGVDYHWGGGVKATLVSTLLGIGSELGLGGDSDLVRALRRGSQDTVNRAGEQIVSRELDIRPTLTIRPGYPVRVLVTRDIIMEQVR